MTTAMTTSMPIHTPADTMCTTRTPLRVRAPNRHGRAPPIVALVITLPFSDAELSWKRGGHMAGERYAGDLAKVRATAPPMNPLPHRSRRSCSRATFLSSFDCWLALDGTARSGGEASTKRWIREVEILAAAPEVELALVRGEGVFVFSRPLRVK